jgi:hypothetical protein
VVWEGCQRYRRGDTAGEIMISMGTDAAVRAVNARRVCITKLSDEQRSLQSILVAKPGGGKSSIIQMYLAGDIKRAKKRQCSVLVIDGDDLIDDHIIPYAGLAGHDNVILIDPLGPMPRFNMFDIRGGNQGTRAQNAAGTIRSMFTVLLNNPPTEPMNTVIEYCAKVMARQPNPTLRTLFQILEAPAQYAGTPGLSAEDSSFFENDLAGSDYRGILMFLKQRCRTILGNEVLCRFMVNDQPNCDLVEAINAGSIILVNTRRHDMTDNGAQLIGRFVKAMIGRASQARLAIPEHLRKPCFAMVDELTVYLLKNREDIGSDPDLARALAGDRKKFICWLIALQSLSQMSPGFSKAVLGTCSNIITGPVNAIDAAALAREMSVGNEGFQEVQAMIKHLQPHEFICSSKGLNRGAPFQFNSTRNALAKLGRHGGAQALQDLYDDMAERYGAFDAAQETFQAEPERRRAVPELRVV